MPRRFLKLLRVVSSILAIAFVFAACEDDPAGPPLRPPGVSKIAAVANPHNALSAVVTFEAQNASVARVLYEDPSGVELATPYYAITGDSCRVATLGLSDTTTYAHRVEVSGPGGTLVSDPVNFRTGEIPDTLKVVALHTTGTSTGGYTITAASATGYVVAFGGDGKIRWYRHIPGLVSRHVRQLENGNFTAFVGWTTGFSRHYGEYIEFQPDGEIVRSHKAPHPLYTDGHDFAVTVSGGAITRSHLFSYYHRRMDMSAYGGPIDAEIAGHQIQRLRPDGTVEFTWDAWDHFTIDDWIEEPLSMRSRAVTDYDHPNSLDIDRDGHYVAGWRHLAEVTKIDSQTGEIIWRLGGRNNQFMFVNDALGDFHGQHSVVVLDDGNLLLYDNGLRHSPQESRAVEYALDTGAMTATLVWEFRHTPPIYTPAVGSVQRLANGNTVVGFGGAAVVSEVDPAGNVVWEGELIIDGTPTAFYRGRRIRSLYEYQRP
jgi:hypothetical protein